MQEVSRSFSSPLPPPALADPHSPQAPYRQFNQILNSLVEAKRISYQRIREIDYIHRGNIRVTRDTDSLQTKPGGIIRKQRIADMNVYCPNHAFDFRISINTETPLGEYSCRLVHHG